MQTFTSPLYTKKAALDSISVSYRLGQMVDEKLLKHQNPYKEIILRNIKRNKELHQQENRLKFPSRETETNECSIRLDVQSVFMEKPVQSESSGRVVVWGFSHKS